MYRNCTDKCTESVQTNVQKLYRNCTDKRTEIVQTNVQKVYRQMYRKCTDKFTFVRIRLYTIKIYGENNIKT
jgi:hypothetical protein